MCEQLFRKLMSVALFRSVIRDPIGKEEGGWPRARNSLALGEGHRSLLSFLGEVSTIILPQGQECPQNILPGGCLHLPEQSLFQVLETQCLLSVVNLDLTFQRGAGKGTYVWTPGATSQEKVAQELTETRKPIADWLYMDSWVFSPQIFQLYTHTCP
jgi:hypothetical protein